MSGNPPYRELIVVIPAHNEANTVGVVVAAFVSMGVPVIVVDDASTDTTAVVARQAGARVVSLMMNLGAWGAIQCGMRKALALGYSMVLSCDADMQHDPHSLYELVDCWKTTSADVVIGSCASRASGARRFAWSVFRYITGLGVIDLTSGLRLYSREAVAVLAGHAGSFVDYQDVGVLLLLREQGMRLVECSVSMCPRVHGHSRIFKNWLVVWEYLIFTMLLSLGGNRFTTKKRNW